MRDQFSVIAATFKIFLQNPIAKIGQLPNWSLKKNIVLQFVFASMTGLAAGLIAPGFWRIMQGLILFPIIVTVMSSLLSCFFYYYFQIFENKTVPYSRLFELVFFADLFYFLFHIAAGLFPPADLIGLSMTALLLIVGLTENFSLERKRAIRLVGVLFSMLFLLWLSEKIANYQRSREPDSLGSFIQERPVEPNPPTPLSVAESSFNSCNSTVKTGQTTS
jgi:hypothetical protein